MSTNMVPNTSATAASASSDLNGAAVQNACEILMKRLEPYRTKDPKGSWEDWVSRSISDIFAVVGQHSKSCLCSSRGNPKVAKRLTV